MSSMVPSGAALILSGFCGFCVYRVTGNAEFMRLRRKLITLKQKRNSVVTQLTETDEELMNKAVEYGKRLHGETS